MIDADELLDALFRIADEPPGTGIWALMMIDGDLAWRELKEEEQS